MASTYSPTLRIELIGTGDQSGTWGSTTNNNLGALLEQAITGVETIPMSDADYTLTALNGSVDEARNAVLVFTSIVPLTATRNIIIPNVEKTYVVKNTTTGSQNIVVKTSGGTGYTVPNGQTASIYCDGTNCYTTITQTPSLVTTDLTATNISATNLTLGSGTTGTGVYVRQDSPALIGTPTAPTAAPGTSTTQLATTAFVGSATGVINSVLTGSLLMWPTVTAPTGYLLCDGTAVSRTTYPALFAVVGTTFGIGDGSTTFNLPDYRDRMPIGAGTSYSANSKGGSKDAVIVSHTHTITDPGHLHGINTYGGSDHSNGISNTGNYPNYLANWNTNTATTGISINSTGSSGTNANLPPYLGIYFVIKT